MNKKKKCQIHASFPITCFEVPIVGFTELNLTTDEIYKCLCSKAEILEVLPNGKTINLDFTNYNKDNFVKEKPKVEESSKEEKDENPVKEDIVEEQEEVINIEDTVEIEEDTVEVEEDIEEKTEEVLDESPVKTHEVSSRNNTQYQKNHKKGKNKSKR